MGFKENQSLDIIDNGGEEERFQVNDDMAADWAVKKIKEIRSDIDRQMIICDQYIAYYQDEKKRLEKKKSSETAFLSSALNRYFSKVPHRILKSGTEKYDLLSGRLSFVPAKEKITKDDDEALVNQLIASGRGNFIKTIYKPDWANYKKHLSILGTDVVDKDTGEVVAGCFVELVPAEFKVETTAE